MNKQRKKKKLPKSAKKEKTAEHKQQFEQLLDDAIFGATKKKNPRG